jgi:hypothetical protein
MKEVVNRILAFSPSLVPSQNIVPASYLKTFGAT